MNLPTYTNNPREQAKFTYRVQYTENNQVNNAYFNKMTAALDFASTKPRALVIDQVDNREVWYHHQ